jgi:hypothetical protein
VKEPAAHSTLVGVWLGLDGTGCVIGVYPDGRADRIDGSAAELTSLVLDILAGKYAPAVPDAGQQKRPPDALLN